MALWVTGPRRSSRTSIPVPASVETFLKSNLGNDAVTRVGGTDRYETAAKVAQAKRDNR